MKKKYIVTQSVEWRIIVEAENEEEAEEMALSAPRHEWEDTWDSPDVWAAAPEKTAEAN